MYTPHVKREQGYTLLEVIVVVMIVSLLTVVSIPNFLAWLHQYRLQAATATMMNHLRAARLLAIFTGVEHQMQIRDHETGNYYQVVEDPKGDDLVVMSIGRVNLNTRYKEVQVKKLTRNGQFTFRPKGTATNGSFVLENSQQKQIRIVIDKWGRIRQEYP